MLSFGEQLRREREDRHITLDQIAGETRISTRHLRALEANELTELPGDVFGRGYVRAYARFLGADAETLLEAYDRQRQILRADHAPIDHRLREAVRAGQHRARRRRLYLLAAAACVVALGATLVIVRLLVAAPSATTAKAERPGEAPAPAARAPGAHPTEPPPSESTAASPPFEPTAAPGPEPAATPTPERASAPSRAEPVAATPRHESSATLPRARASAPPLPAPAKEANAPDRAPPAPKDRPASPPPATRLSVSESRVRRPDPTPCAEGARVWFVTRVQGGRPGDRIEHVWRREGNLVQTVTLAVSSSSWRTRSYKTLGPIRAGTWDVEARTTDGTVLAHRRFRCPPPAP